MRWIVISTSKKLQSFLDSIPSTANRKQTDWYLRRDGEFGMLPKTPLNHRTQVLKDAWLFDTRAAAVKKAAELTFDTDRDHTVKELPS